METNNIEQLKENIRQYIKQNGNKEITGQLLQEVLLGMVDGLVGNDAVANPEGEAAEILEKIGIAGINYTAPQGPQGVSPTVQVTQIENGYHVVITDKDGAHAFDLTNGPANTLSIGTVTDGEQASASITGDAPNQQLNLVLPKGEQGDPGQNAVNPFKGWFTTANIPTTGQEGDYCNVSDTSVTPHTVTIYRWSTQQNEFVDTGEVPDTANAETFASSEELNQVAIDESQLVNPVNTADPTQPVLAKAEDVMQLKAKLGGATASEVKVNAVVGTNVTTGSYVSGETGLPVTPGSSASSYAYFELAIPQGTKSIRFATGTKTSGAKSGYSFGHYEENVYVPTRMFYFDISETTPPTGIVEKTIEVLDGETTFMSTVEANSTYASITLDKFYCYLRSGETIVDFVNKNSIFNYVETNVSPNLMQGDYVNFVIYQNGKWGQSTFSDDYTRSAIIPIKEGDVLTIESLYHQNSFAFLSEYPTNPVAGEYAPVIGSTYLIGPDNVYTKRVISAPVGSKYLAVKLRESSQDWRPSSIAIYTKVPAKIDSYLTDETYDTYIEEDIFRYDSGPTVNGLKKKIYKRDKSVEYKLIIHIPDTATSTVHYLNGNFEVISDAFGFGSGSDYETDVIVSDDSYRGRLLRMESMDIPADCEYIQVDVRMWQETGKSTTYGLGALMKPLKEDGTMPQNELIYCVSRIKRPLIPNGYDEEGTYQPDGYVWSPWAFMFPYGADSITGKKFPIVPYFHGGTGIVTSECFGYNSGLKQWPILSMLRARGCIVFDINGYGIYPKQGYVTSHQGCPTALHTIKKAYETIVNRFNGRRGMVLSGISMGGQTAKGYAMTYPQDCIALALAAPGEIGLNMRVSDNSETFKCVYYGWEYGDKGAIDADPKREKFIGYSPLVKPQVIQEDGTLKNMTEAMDYTAADMFANENKFSAPFPVEIKIWHGSDDTTVLPRNSRLFVNTVRNAGCNASLRICPNCDHNFTDLLWVRQEIVDYIMDKLSI